MPLSAKRRAVDLLILIIGVAMLYLTRKGYIDLPPDAVSQIVVVIIGAMGALRVSQQYTAGQIIKADVANPATPTTLATLGIAEQVVDKALHG